MADERSYVTKLLIGPANEYPTMHYIGIPRHTLSMKAYKILNGFPHEQQSEDT